MKVTYLQLGDNQDPFYGKMAAFMRCAAEDLGVELEVIECFRDSARIRSEGEALIGRAKKPDLLLLPNHKGLAIDLVPKADAAGIRVFLVNEGLLVGEKGTLGEPGGKYPRWLGELVPDEREYGRLLASYLIGEARRRGLVAGDGRIHMCALTGGFTFASISRRSGLQAAVSGQPDVHLASVLPADWERHRARELMAQSLASNPETSIVWSASDDMLLGAVEAIEAAGRRPGRDVLLGGVDWAPFVPDRIREGLFTASVGGHFMDGAWALVMAFDHHQGVTADISHARSKPALLTRETLDDFAMFFDERRWSAVDFDRFSRSRNPGLQRYDLTVEAVRRSTR
ncbi:MAG TPA: ABC transporter substrate-binding protein [Thermoanaerobaculia bacterium]|nr:ABC transporter substrate-binding protein [Thermoanaerobaculia bacterium]